LSHSTARESAGFAHAAQLFECPLDLVAAGAREHEDGAADARGLQTLQGGGFGRRQVGGDADLATGVGGAAAELGDE
jgi:hypothetical protein